MIVYYKVQRRDMHKTAEHQTDVHNCGVVLGFLCHEPWGSWYKVLVGCTLVMALCVPHTS